MKAQIDIKDEAKLKVIRTLAIINGVDVGNKDKLINFAIDTLHSCIVSLDESSLLNVCNLKKGL
jgi:hypothetical protein